MKNILFSYIFLITLLFVNKFIISGYFDDELNNIQSTSMRFARPVTRPRIMPKYGHFNGLSEEDALAELAAMDINPLPFHSPNAPGLGLYGYNQTLGGAQEMFGF